MSARYTLYIGSKNRSAWSLRPWLAMKMAKVPFEEVVIKLRTPETKANILAHSPSGKVPALKIEGNGSQIVWDSLAICETIAERHPAAGLWPKDVNARARARSIAAEMHSGFADMRKALSVDITARHPTPALDDSVQRDVARIIAIWTNALSEHGKDGGGFLCGQFGIADAFYAPVVTRFETYGIKLPAVAQAYSQRVLSLAPMREWEAAAKAETQTKPAI